MTKKIIFTREQTKEIKDLFLNKYKNVIEIGKIFGCCSPVIYKVLKKENIVLNMGNRKKLLFKVGKIKPNQTCFKVGDPRVLKMNLENNPSWREDVRKKQSKTRIRLYEEGKLIPIWKDKNLPEETCIKISKAKKQQYLEGKLSSCIGARGDENPARDLKVKNKMSMSKIGKRMSIKTEFKKGMIPHTKGKTKENYEPLRIISEKIKILRPNWIIPTQDTSIEVKIQGFLKQLGIEHFTHWFVKDIEHYYRCDIFIPVQNGINKKTIIECDGDYFHANPKFYSEEKLNKKQKAQKERDNFRTQELISKGFRVLRLWEKEIKVMDLNNFQERLLTIKKL